MDEICKIILRWKKMTGRITGFLREYVLGFSILILIIGFVLLFIGVLWYGFQEFVNQNNTMVFIADLGNWNGYILVIGIIILMFGVYYLYNYLKNKQFIMKELNTNKRSELLKKHKELRTVVKRMPSKYKSLLIEKEEELNIK
jgi:hypothetical protein